MRRRPRKRALFRIADVAELAEISLRTAQLYVDLGLVSARADAPAPRRGSPRSFTRANLVEVLVVREMLDHGFKVEEICSVFKNMRGKKQHLRLDPERKWWRQRPPDEKKDPFVRLVVANLETGSPRVVLIVRDHFKPSLGGYQGIRIVPIQHIFEEVDAYE